MPPMGLYREQVFPRIMNRLMDDEENRAARERVCAPLTGEVVEIGFGTGLNLPHLPPAVTVLRAVEPLGVGVALAGARRRASPVPVEVSGLDGQSLPFDDASVDAVLCTWTLCSIPDPVAAVREVRRVLRPGGALHFVEHGRAPDERVRRWQDRCNPIQRRVACGCNLNRDILAVIAFAGMRVEQLSTYYVKGAPKAIGATFEGTAVATGG